MKWFIVYLFLSATGQETGMLILPERFYSRVSCEERIQQLERERLPGKLGIHSTEYVAFCTNKKPM